MLRFALIFTLLIIPKITKPQSVSTLMGARSAALGNASSTLTDGWSLFNNTAGLAKANTTSANFAYALNPALPGANKAAAAITAPFRVGTFAAGMFRFGDDLYSEQIIATGYANQFGIASLGLKANFIQYRAEGHQTRSALSLNFGGIAEITPMIAVGAYIANINQPKISSDDDERLPVKLVTGIQFNPDENLILLMEVEKDISYDPTFRAAIEYEFYKKIDFRTGFNLNPNSINGGVGYKSGRLSVDYAVQYNPDVLTSYQISTSYRFIKRQTE